MGRALGLALLALVAPSAAAARVHTVSQAGAWARPSGKFEPTRVHARTRRVRIEVVSGGCLTYRRAEVTRTRDAVVITAIFDRLESDSPYTAIPCPYGSPKLVAVGLHGRLGHRAVVDGSDGMPRYAGHGRVGVPDVRGVTVADAYDRVRGYGFRVAIPEPFAIDHRCPAAGPSRQFPKAGRRVRRGTVVRLEAIECGPAAPAPGPSEQHTVPDVTGLHPDAALQALAGFDVDQSYAALPPSTIRTFDANYRVATQTPRAGSQSKGPVTITLH